MKRKFFLSIAGIFFSALITIISGCATVKDVAGSLIVKGEMNYFAADANCWVLESGNVTEKKFYQLSGDESDMKKIQMSEAQVTVRILPRPDVKPTCRIATYSADLIEVIDVSPR